MKFLNENQILDTIRKLTKKREPIRIAVAYWGKNSPKETGLIDRIQKSDKDVKIICDLRSGACNPSPINKLMNSKASIRTLDNMHAKVWICGADVIVGSANVSANGLGFDDVKSLGGNIEAAIHTNSKECAATARNWFDSLWDRSDEVSKEHIHWATDQWRIRNKTGKPRRAHRKFLIETVKSGGNLKAFDNVHVLAWLESDYEMSEEGTVYLEEGSRDLYSESEWANDDRRDCYPCALGTKWEFKKGQIFLDFRAPYKGARKLSFKGIYRIISDDGEFHETSREWIVLNYKEPDCKGYIFAKSEQTELTKLIEQHLNEIGWDEERPDGNLLDCGILDFFGSVNKKQ